MSYTKTADRELRKAFAETLEDLINNNENIVYLEADLAGAIGSASVIKNHPEQAFNVGIQEANMVGVACGMSLKGKIPFVHSFGIFSSRRVADQLYLSGCYNKANVRILGTDPGVSAELNGGTHMPLEDIGVLRSFPGLTILDVADPYLLDALMRKSAAEWGMYYIRFPRKLKTAYYEGNETITIGKGNILRDGQDVCIIASGIEVPAALSAADELSKDGISVRVVDMHTIKPIDAELIEKCAKECKIVVTADNHNVIGGLGTAVAEVIAESGITCRFKRVGVPDTFGEVGSIGYLSEKFGIDAGSIEKAVRSLV